MEEWPRTHSRAFYLLDHTVLCNTPVILLKPGNDLQYSHEESFDFFSYMDTLYNVILAGLRVGVAHCFKTISLLGL